MTAKTGPAAKSTTDSTPRLSEVARHLVIPEGIVTSVFPRVERRLESVGVGFDRWQQGFGTVALGCREDGKFAATIGGVVATIPRQVGKTFTVGRLLVGLSLEIPGYQVAWTSHHNRTTARTFQSIRALVRSKRILPHLDSTARSDGTRQANGQEEIRFKNGSLMLFGAREQGFGRGMEEIDAEVFDEAQILGLKALEDMVPAVNQARNPHGGLLFFLGTPPRPTDPGEAFTAKRDQALSGKSKDICYVEFSADPDSDPDDESQWPIMNPSYPLRTPRESMLRMRENIPDDDSWNREARGIWPASGHHAIISGSDWADLISDGPDADVPPAAFGVDMSHRKDISIVAAWSADDVLHIEEVFSGWNVAKAVEWLTRAAGRRIPVLIDSYSPAAQMVPDLTAAKVKVKRTSVREMTTGAGIVESRLGAGTLTHADQQSMTLAVLAAVKRPIGDAGGFGWDRKDASKQIHPLVAASLAVAGAAGEKRRSGAAGFA